jgi:hypothetical protein
VVEETRVPEPARAGDEGAAAAATVQTTPESMEPVVELPLSGDEYGDSRDINPAAETSAAARIAEFISASKDILGTGTSEGPGHGANYAIVQSGVPSEFLHNEQGEEEEAWKAQYDVGTQIHDALGRAFQFHQKTDFLINKVSTFTWESLMLPRLERLREISHNKSAELARLYSQLRWLGQYNASLVVRTIEANTLVNDLGARQCALEEELAQAANERDAQRAAVERKAQEVKA